jgi:ABC-2 type transport system permease protein
MTAFWTERVHSIVGFGHTLIFLLGGTAAPIGLLPDAWRRIAEASPFYAMSGLPAEIATYGMSTVADLGLQLFWLAVLLVSVRFAWRAGVRRYTAVGS